MDKGAESWVAPPPTPPALCISSLTGDDWGRKRFAAALSDAFCSAQLGSGCGLRVRSNLPGNPAVKYDVTITAEVSAADPETNLSRLVPSTAGGRRPAGTTAFFFSPLPLPYATLPCRLSSCVCPWQDPSPPM